MGRLSQSLLEADRARMQLYVDDPILTICASPAYTERVIALMALAWLIMGFGLSFHKAQRGSGVDWDGYVIAAHGSTVRIQIKQ